MVDRSSELENLAPTHGHAPLMGGYLRLPMCQGPFEVASSGDHTTGTRDRCDLSRERPRMPDGTYLRDGSRRSASFVDRILKSLMIPRGSGNRVGPGFVPNL